MGEYLIVSPEDMARRGVQTLDFVCITGDAYVDHPSFGTPLIARWLEREGYAVGLIAQPDFHSTRDFMRLGRPNYAFVVSSGNIDSMVAHYTAAKKRRSDDAYTPGGRAGRRPDRAVIVYCQKLREAYPDVPIVIGGIEASLRRFAHYDYWDDAVRPSILLESGADLLVYGMGELQTSEYARRFAEGRPASSMTDIPGTAVVVDRLPKNLKNAVVCESLEEVSSDKAAYARACKTQYDEQDYVTGRTVYQRHGDVYVRQNPPMRPLTREEFDSVYELPFQYYYHPSYEAEGGVAAIEEVEFSIIHNRGCFGTCNFCALALHDARTILCRRRAASRRTRASRAIFTMSEGRRQTFACPPAKSSSNTASARTESASRPRPARA